MTVTMIRGTLLTLSRGRADTTILLQCKRQSHTEKACPVSPIAFIGLVKR